MSRVKLSNGEYRYAVVKVFQPVHKWTHFILDKHTGEVSHFCCRWSDAYIKCCELNGVKPNVGQVKASLKEEAEIMGR